MYRRGVGDDNVEWTAWGTVTAYLPTSKITDRRGRDVIEPALWRIEHDDGDFEEMEAHEVKDAVALYATATAKGVKTAADEVGESLAGEDPWRMD